MHSKFKIYLINLLRLAQYSTMVLLGSACLVTANSQSLEFVFADSLESVPVTVYRNTQLALRDPHVFVNVPVFGCVDFTDTPIPVVNVSFNGTIADMLTMDTNADDVLDLSILQGFDRANTDGIGQMVTAINGSCAAPFPPTSCLLESLIAESIATTNIETGLCLEAVVGTTTGYTPPVPIIQDACFVATPTDTEAMLGGVILPLLQSQFAFGWMTNQLTPGLNLGFLREIDADNTLLPDTLPIIGGQPLSSILPGGQGSCAPGDDRDVLNAETGWWFYLETMAEEVTIDSL